jgi:hypothetical protein
MWKNNYVNNKYRKNYSKLEDAARSIVQKEVGGEKLASFPSYIYSTLI